MSEIRRDFISGRYVIIATERNKRPGDFSYRIKNGNPDDFCPFCTGNETRTPPEVYALRDKESAPDTPGWEIRVVPNKFAAVRPDGIKKREDSGPFASLSGKGSAEVIIETPLHEAAFSSYSLEHLVNLLAVIQQRYRFLARAGDVRYVQPFKNYGAGAGASLRHPHWQIISIPVIPSTVKSELQGAAAYQRENGECAYCRMIAEEKKQGLRLITENSAYAAITPYASRYPYESWILPKKHQESFASASRDSLSELSRILKSVFTSLEAGFPDLPYNLIIHSSPVDSGDYSYYHWHLELIPRLSVFAGFELGTGCCINVISPENAAQFLRSIQTTCSSPF